MSDEPRVWVEDRNWRLVVGERRCRYVQGRVFRCPNMAVAELKREYSKRFVGCTVPRRHVSWWAYCTDHMYGRRIEDGKILTDVHPDSPAAERGSTFRPDQLARIQPAARGMLGVTAKRWRRLRLAAHGLGGPTRVWLPPYGYHLESVAGPVARGVPIVVVYPKRGRRRAENVAFRLVRIGYRVRVLREGEDEG